MDEQKLLDGITINPAILGGKPIARGKGANFNKLVPFDRDPVSTGVDACVKVKVYKV